MATLINLAYKQVTIKMVNNVSAQIQTLLEDASKLITLMKSIRNEIKDTTPFANIFYHTLIETIETHYMSIYTALRSVQKDLAALKGMMSVRQNVLVSKIVRQANAMTTNLNELKGQLATSGSPTAKFPVEHLIRTYTKNVDVDSLVDPIQWRIDAKNRSAKT